MEPRRWQPASSRRGGRPSAFLVATVAVACCCSGPRLAEATDRPIWAILSQPNRITSSSDKPAFSAFPIDWSFINADYVKWIESAGARVVPLRYDAPAADIDAVLAQVNGLIFPGGNDIIDPGSPYYTAARYAFDRALAMNDAGDHFPIHGTCLGLELLAELVTERAALGPPSPGDNGSTPAAAAAAAAAVLTPVDAENISLALRFHAPDPPRASTLYSLLSEGEVAALARRNLTENFHHYGVTLETWRSTPALPQFFRLISDSSDRGQVPFASTIEARRYPIFATQWHPERSLYEWGPTEDINHSPAAVRIVQLVADALVRNSRLSRHRFPSPDAEAVASIYNSQVMYRERVSTPQLYLFPPFGQQNQTVEAATTKGRLRGSVSSSMGPAATAVVATPA